MTMSTDSDPASRTSLATSAKGFVADFVRFAGRRGIVAGVYVIVGAMLEGFGLLLIVPLLAIVTGAGGASTTHWQKTAEAWFDALGVHDAFGRLALLLGIFSLLMILRAIVMSRRDFRLAKLQTGFVQAQRAGIAERLAAAQWDQVVRLRHARITHLMSDDVQRIGMIVFFLMQATITATVLITQSILALVLAPGLALLVITLLALSGLALRRLLRRARNLGIYLTNANLSLLNSTAQFLGGLKFAISQSLQNSFLTEFQSTLNEMTNRQVSYVRQQTNTRLAVSTLAAIAGAILVLIGFGVFHTPAPVLITLLLVIGRISGPATQIQQSLQQVASALPAYEKVKALHNELATIGARMTAADAPNALPAGGPITFENVSYRHESVDQVEAARGVDNLSLCIPAGEFLGIAGASGAGKTTFADLLVGLYPPQSGRIAVGDTALENETLTAWRKQISYISQDPFLFHDTIRRNLSWVNPAASEQQMWDALAFAGADGLVRRMAEGLDTIAGERGTLFSGGERQRIALARALLRAPCRLLVLDEATSALDVASEREILERLRALEPRPTIILVAHRNESLALCDRVLRLDADGFAPA